jgi:hypothetical protein
VSPSLAREMVMLRLPPRRVLQPVELVQGPRLASRPPRLVEGPALVEEPRLVSRAAFTEPPSPEPASATNGFWSGLLRYLPVPSAPDGGN